MEQEKPDTARRASGDSTTSSQINRTIILLNAEESHLSLGRTGSEPLASLGLRQRPSAQQDHFLAIFRLRAMVPPGQDPWDRTRQVHQGPSVLRTVHCQPPKSSPTARHRRSLTRHLSIQRNRWCCSGSPPPVYRSGPHRRLSCDVSYSYAEQFMVAKKARLFQDRRAEELLMSSSDRRAHKCIGRGVRNFNNAI